MGSGWPGEAVGGLMKQNSLPSGLGEQMSLSPFGPKLETGQNQGEKSKEASSHWSNPGRLGPTAAEIIGRVLFLYVI